MNIENIPYDAHAEQTIIGALAIGGDIDTMISEVQLKASDFYIAQNQAIFSEIVKLHENNIPVDIVTLHSALQGNQIYSGIDYIKTAARSVPTTRHLKYYAEIVKEMSTRRNLIMQAQVIQEAAADSQKDIKSITDIAEQMTTLDVGKISISSFSDLFIPVYDNLVSAYEKKGEIPGQKTGWISFDTAIGGLEGLIVIGARPSMGKTMFGTNIAEYIAFKENKPALLFSLEMTKEQIGMRIIASQACVKYSDCKFGTLSGEDFAQIGNFANIPNGKNLIICDEPMINISRIKSVARICKRQNGEIGVIVIDYIQLMDFESSSRTTRTEEIGKISRSLKLLSKELNCPIVVLSQLSREVEKRAEKRPMLSDLRDSGAIEQDADTIVFLYRDDYYNKDSRKRGIAEIIISKARHGETGTIELSFQPQIMRFMEKSEIERIRKEREKEKKSK